MRLLVTVNDETALFNGGLKQALESGNCEIKAFNENEPTTGIVPKVQRGVAVIPSNEYEIVVELERPVNPERAVAVYGGSIYGTSNNYGGYSGHWDARFELVDDRHIKATRAYNSIYTASVAWQVVSW